MNMRNKHLMAPQQLHLFPTDPPLLQYPQNPQQIALSCFLPPKPAGLGAAGALGSLGHLLQPCQGQRPPQPCSCCFWSPKMGWKAWKGGR